MVLMGTEVKSLRAGRASLVDGFAEMHDGEVWLHGVHIPEYTQGTWTNHAARRKRKLLLNRARDRQDRVAGQRARPDPGPAVAVLQGRPRQGRDRARQGQEDLRQAARARRAAGEPGEGAGDRPPAQGHPVTLADSEVPAWAERLGLPGLYDVHVHFLPPDIMAKVWAQFDSAGPKIGRPWPITYRGTDDERVAQLRALGVRRFSALPYAHRPGVAGYFNDWAAEFAAATPECLHSATFYPEPEAADYVAEAIDAGVEIFKVHVQVGNFDVRDPHLDKVWGQIADAGTPVVVHAGSGPVPNEHTGPAPVLEVLRRHPRLTAVLAHMGAPEYVGVPRDRRGVRAGAPRHDDGVHRLLRGDGAVPGRSAAPAAGPRRQGAARLGLPEHPLPLRPPAGVARARWAWARSGCARSAGRTPRPWSAEPSCHGKARARGNIVRTRSVVPGTVVTIDNSTGADRFRLGTLVPGEAGRGSKVISLTILGNQ